MQGDFSSRITTRTSMATWRETLCLAVGLLLFSYASAQCTQGDVRLVGGSSQFEGRVEVCNSGSWGTVCDDLWDITDANVVCAQLAYGAATSALCCANFGQGTGFIWLDNVGCTGTETNIFDCPNNGVGSHNCGHSEDAGVVCTGTTTSCDQGDIRLVGGTNERQGRVEVCNSGAWGTVCDDGFSATDAQVVCRQLGFSTTGATSQCCAAYGQGSGAIVLDNLACAGDETSLFSCLHNGLNTHNCGHSEDVGVTCQAGCDQGSIRLVGGSSNLEGRVEVCDSNAWGTVCDDGFGTPDANVACLQLGFSNTGATASCCAAFGQGSGAIVLDNLACAGSETSLFSCPHNGLNTHNCGHSEDVGITCQVAVTPAPCVQGDIRLVGGTNEFQGRVEVCNNGAWGTVCDDGFSATDAEVVCRQLGFSPTGATASCCAAFGQGSGAIVLDDLACAGDEASVFSCPHNGVNNHNCGHGEDVGVTCQAGCVQGSIRLVGGSSNLEGRVEVCDSNAWGTVCDDGFATPDANVACRQLGFSDTGATASCCAAFGQGTGVIVLDDLGCSGTEASLFDCPRANIHNCGHSEDVGIVCQAGTVAPPDCMDGAVRLVGGSNAMEGRVEVCNSGAWGTVCDDGWTVVDASVVCAQLGFGFATSAPCCANFGQGTGQIVLDNVACTGTETMLFDCPHNGLNIHNCAHGEDAGVVCAAPACQQGDVRLVGGSNAMEGRVEVCDGGAWGTVCDDGWAVVDASVVCTQLGFGVATSAPCCANFGQGTGNIVLDNVACTGTETMLFDCPHNGLNIHNCGHGEDAGVVCAVCTQGDVRLVGGSSHLEGRVEVCDSNAWGTVCDDLWDTNDATVVCRQLGLGTATSAPCCANFGQGTGNIVLDNLACAGTESSLFDCPHNGLNVHNCGHSEDAGLRCSGDVAQCTNGELRLQGGEYNTGRVEICDMGVWGTICDDGWGISDASVACRQLGFPSATTAQCCAAYGPGTGSIVLDDLACAGTESALTDCPHSGLNVHNCAHTEDAGAICEANVRLVGGGTMYEGRVEVYSDGAWGTVCDDAWGINDAMVVCRQLGFGAATNAPCCANFGQGTGQIVLDNVACTGSETNLFACPHNGVNIHNCGHGEDASVICTAPTVCTQGDVRLVGGTNSAEGRVEVCNMGVWGTVCDDLWGTNDANVVCRQLGYAGAAATNGAPCCAAFGQGTGDIVLDNVGCTGAETALFDCPHNGINIHNCAHSEDAGVRCVTCNQGDIRLVGGTSELEGRVEVCNNNEWGTVCDDGWDVTDGAVACAQLGFEAPGPNGAPCCATFGQGTGPIVLDNLACTGSESSLIDCPHNGLNIHNCGHGEDAGLRCNAPGCTEGELRLVGGTTDLEGRVEICHDLQWGTVCDDLWDNNDAMVVCRQLGYQGGVARLFAAFGQGLDPIWLDNVACTGTELTLAACPNNGFGVHNCAHSEDASVICDAATTPPPVCNQGDIRLVGGADERQGRVEVCDSNAWGTVCDDGFGSEEASVACIQLGYPGTGATAQSFAFYGQGTGAIVLDDVVCTGAETSIFDCMHGGNNNHNCAHSEDVGITCQRVCIDGDVRLVNGPTNRAGRVEICDNEQWGTVCDDFWDNEDAGVVCFQLGYGRSGTSSGFAAFGQGTGPIFLDDVGCSGMENRLIDCSHLGIGAHNCAHFEDAGVTCDGMCTDGDVRLIGGSDQYEGRVEVCMTGVWGTVCDDFWNAPDAQVVCGQLGFPTLGATARSQAFFGQGTGDILIDDVMCVGTESRLVDCPLSTTHNCAHSEDAGVVCPSPVTGPPCTDNDLRLVGGSSDLEGRVEVCMGGIWGTVCDDFWGDEDASVVCSQLGYSRSGAIGRTFAFFGQGSGPIFLDDVMCVGDEPALQDCPATTIHNCAHSEDAGVTCIFCEEGGLRLVNGPNDWEGRVEVCYQQQWGTVCDDFWSINDANVACRQAGYSRFGASAPRNAAYGQGTGPIVLDNLQCDGSEESLFNCTHNGVNIHNCGHAEDAGAVCIPNLFCAQGDVRIVNGPTVNIGRVEVCVNEEWGTICDDNWDSVDAGIVCAQRGFSRFNATAIPFAVYGQGTGPILLDELRCVGTEDNLLNCPRNELAVHDCSHFEDASVECQVQLLCQDGDIRLAGDLASGANEMNGRVEICHNEEWGTVCDDGWSNEDATVVCRQLGFSDIGAVSVSFAAFGQGTGPIILDQVSCVGDEMNILSCPSNPIRIHDCSHFEDAGVRCQALPQPCMNGDVRLVGGSVESEGRVEFCQDEEWGTVCDDFWSLNDANVVCAQLGYVRNGNNMAHSSAFFGPGTGSIFLDNVFCTGTEERLDQCQHNGVGIHNCAHSEDAGVTCQQCVDGAIRLVNGANEFEGRVEVCDSSIWGTVCDDLWDDNDAAVACRQAGFLTDGAIARSFAFFSQGTGPIVLDNLQCVGTESSLFDCPHNGLNIHNCAHSEDAGVTCPPPSCNDGDVRLQDGPTPEEGRLEICIGNEWYAVCDTNFGDEDASVVCRQLGFSRFHSVATTGSSYGPSSRTTLFDNAMCNGTETEVSQCAHSQMPGPRCSNTTEAGAMCRAELVCEHYALRLVGGSTEFEGRVELCIDETWHTVCADGAWTNTDANVACREAGYAATGATAFTSAFFGQGVGPIHADDFGCLGTESRLFDCPIVTFGACLGGHGQDAGVRCNEGCTHGELRLAGGTSDAEGRVEVCFNGAWGTVCDDAWGVNDAAVVCGQLGLLRAGAVALSFSFFGQGIGDIHLDDVACTGSESRLIDCPYTPQHNCIHLEDAGVRCQGCVPGEIRLASGTRPSEGRVEVCMNDVWGTVCDDAWGLPDATVVCRQLGFSVIGAIARPLSFFSPPVTNNSVPIYLDDVACVGTEDRLTSCTHTINHNCVHAEDAGVTCSEIVVCNNGELRLVGGSDRLEGRLEVCQNEVWGTVCDDGWDALDAGVACRQLGFSRFNATAYSQAIFGEGTGAIYLDNIQCTGSELRLRDCFLSTNASECTHAEDASLRCSDTLFCQNGELRLVGGTNQFEGRVELCYNETWGSVCDGFWSVPDANVACRQLGYQPTGAIPFYDAQFGEGTGPIWLDDLICTGDEERLLDCFFPGLLMTDFCNGHADDAGVRCMEGCVNGNLRLADGSAPGEGRVEVCMDQQFGTVCHDQWDKNDASVVCKQLGFSRFGAVANPSAAFGPGTGAIHFDNVACVGMEDSLFDCVYDMDTSDCGHSQDAGVTCMVDLVCQDGDLRLGGTATIAGEGRVEICIGETWGTICDNDWDNDDATVACRGLGFSRFGAIGVRSAFYGAGDGSIFLDMVGCTGNELSLLDCPNSMTTTSCTHSSDASVRCNPAPACQDGDIRLITPAGSRNNSGRVEVCLNEQWGTVCDNNWSQVDANVACRQLGFSRYNAVARPMAFYGQGSAAINLDNLGCIGDESRLIDCPFPPNNNCGHDEDAGVDCSTVRVCEEGDVRLVGGMGDYEGRVEVCINETFSTICDADWSLNDANILCAQLGYLGENAVIYSSFQFGQGTGPIGLTNLRCSGNEMNIFECPFNEDTSMCTHVNDAGVTCQEVCTDGSIRLVDGTNELEGRVEVCLNQQWGTVCDDLWGTVDAGVACKQLGYSEHNATALILAPFGQGTGPIWLDNLACLGFEDSLFNCTYDSHTADCLHFEDAGLRCQPCSTGDIRLEGGSTLYEGRVEVCRDQTWGTVCDDSWSSLDATVVCRHLGFSGIDAMAFQNAHFGQGFGPIYLDDVQCSGTEIDLFDCTAMTTHNCDHTEDAGVLCNFPPVCTEMSVRLQGGGSFTEGRVEICQLEAWNTVCDNLWGNEDAAVVCKQLGFSKFNAYANVSAAFGQGIGPIYGTDFVCNGEEEQITDCQVNLNALMCSHANDAGVTCSATLLCNDGDIRLFDGPSMLQGRVEVCDDEVWGTVCDDFWSQNDANVACRQLGFAPIGATPLYGAPHGVGNGPIFLDVLLCTGQESRLVDCSHAGIGNTGFCTGGHNSDASVICGEVCTSGDIRLVNTNNSYEGRVEVCKDQAWGTVCDDFWSVEDANVACRQAGFSGFGAVAHGMAFFGQGTGLIHLDDLMCTGTEESLFDCAFDSTHNCFHGEDAGVTCQPEHICDDGELRLCDGMNCDPGLMSGRLEICMNEVWGTVCDNSWSVSDANVACTQLGFSTTGAIPFSGSQLGAADPDVPISLGGLLCTGTETNITQCPSTGTDGCSHSRDAGLQCQEKLCSNGDIRLVGGTRRDSQNNTLEGRVEFCWNEQWGTVCDNDYDFFDAAVICRQAGFSRINAVRFTGSDPGNTFGRAQTNVPVFLDNLDCTGTEASVLQCTYTGIGNIVCPHTKDSAASCEIRQAFPTNVNVAPDSDTSLSVSWTTPDEFYSTLSKYTVMCGNVPMDVPAGSTLTIVPGLNAATEYTCCVQAVYTDPTENAMMCGTGTTNEGIPGAPINLDYDDLDAGNCDTVTLTWDPPSEDERNGMISMYQVEVTNRDTSQQVTLATATTNSYTVNSLLCCQDYDFQVSAATSAGFGAARMHTEGFRTLADLSDPITVTLSVDSDTSITIGWVEPSGLLPQHASSDTYTLVITPQCLNGQQGGINVPASQSVGYLDNPVFTVPDLAPLVPYNVRLSAVICESQVTVYDETIFTREPATGTITPPSIVGAARFPNTPTTARVQWDSSSADVNELAYYSGLTYVPNQLVRTALINSAQTQIDIQGLDVCTTYWFVARAATCGAESFSTPFKLELQDATIFQLFVNLDDQGDCNSFINTGLDMKIRSVEDFFMNEVLRTVTCDLISVDCFAGSTFTCSPDDRSTVIFSTTLVGTSRFSSDSQATCLNEWASGSPNIAGTGQVRGDGGTTSPTVAPTGVVGGLPDFGIALIIVFILILVIVVLVLIAVICLVRRRPVKERSTSDVPHQLMDDQDDTRSHHSIGIVENPLYAEQDGFDTPSYAALSAKEKEAEAEFGIAQPPTGQDFSINFDPPGPDDY